MTSFYDADFDDEELLPSTCWTRWTDINGTHAMRRGYEELRENTGTHAPIPCYLPPSFHQTVSQAARHLLNPFRTKGASLLESVLLTVVTIFRGRVIVQKTPIRKTSVTSRNAIEHRICATEGTLLVVLRVPRVATDEVDYVTQLFKAMLSAATHVHRDVPPHRQLRVYGLLTDSMHFEFYSYDPVTETAHLEVDYDLALTLAEDARGLFAPETITQEEPEIRASKAFDLLHQSISIVPREMKIASHEQELVSQ